MRWQDQKWLRSVCEKELDGNSRRIGGKAGQGSHLLDVLRPVMSMRGTHNVIRSLANTEDIKIFTNFPGAEVVTVTKGECLLGASCSTSLDSALVDFAQLTDVRTSDCRCVLYESANEIRQCHR